MKRRLLSILTLLCLTVTSVWADESWTSGDCTVTFSSGTLTISCTGAMADYEAPEDRPWDLYIEDITSVVVEDGVTSVGQIAFRGCENLTSVALPNSVTSIGDLAFYDCTNLTSVTLPNNLTAIGYCAFSATGLTSIEIPAGVTSIGVCSFGSCTNLSSVTLPDGLTSIDNSAFIDCSNLTSVTLPDGLERIGERAFSGCEKLESVTLPDGLESIGDYAFEATGLTSVEIPASVTSIGSQAFRDCVNLESVTLPDGLKSIGSSAFSSCEKLESVTLPDGLESIDNGAFAITGLTSVEIPASVTSIGSSAFKNCSDLSTVNVLGTTPATLGEDAFYGNASNRRIYVPSGKGETYRTNWAAYEDDIYVIVASGNCGSEGHEEDVTYTFTDVGKMFISGTGAMADYEAPENRPWHSDIEDITSVVVEDGVTSVGKIAFRGCENLTSVTLPNSVTSIGDLAFRGCSNLTSVMLPNSLTNIGHNSFSATGLTSVEIPNSVKDIKNYAFWNCISLESVTLHEGLTGIGNNAFKGCENLTSITLPNSLITIYGNAFCNTGLTSVEIPASVTVIGYEAFEGCKDLATVIVHGTTPATLDGCSFDDNASGRKIYVPYGTGATYRTNWSDYAEDIKEMDATGNCGTEGHESEVTWRLNEEGVMTISGTGAMADYADSDDCPWCSYISRITSVVVEDGVTSIGDLAFSDCSNLETVTIGSGVTSIGDNAFFACDKVTDVYCYANPAALTWNDNGCDDFKSDKATICHVYADRLSEFETKWSTGSTGTDGTDVNVTFKGDLAGKDSPDKVLWAYDGGTLTISGTGAMKDYADSDDCPWRSYINLITSVVVEDGVTSVGQNAFNGCWKLTSVMLPDALESIGSHAFDNCYNLTSITLPDALTSIGSYAFRGCYNLTSVSLPDALTSISSHAFSDCYNLTSITLPDALTSIGDAAFDGCENLTSVEIPASVTSIGDYAFNYCTNLSTVYIYAPSLDTYGGHAFDDNASGRKIYVFNDCVKDYKEGWSDYADDIEPITLTANEGKTGEYWTTYYNEYSNCKAPEGTQVFKMTLNGTSLSMTEIEDGIINKGEAVVLKSSSDSILPEYSESESEDDYSGNSLEGTMTRISNPGNAFVLNKKGDAIGFYKLSDTGHISAHKAYLTYAGGSIKSFAFDSATELNEVQGSQAPADDVWYTLDGRRLDSKPTAKGIYIVGGKKVVKN